MIKHILLVVTFLFYTHQECRAEVYHPNITALQEELQGIIVRETRNLEHLENSYKKFSKYYMDNIDDVQFDGELVRNQEIVEDTLVNIKLKLHLFAYVKYSELCYSEAYEDLNRMHQKFLSDQEQCRKTAYTTYSRIIRDFLAFKKASKRIKRRVFKILQVCTFQQEESSLCKRQYVPIKELAVLGNHTYQYEHGNVHLMDNVLQTLRDCNALAIKPAAELAMYFVDTIDEECDYVP